MPITQTVQLPVCIKATTQAILPKFNDTSCDVTVSLNSELSKG
jgi:hypothetical protein